MFYFEYAKARRISDGFSRFFILDILLRRRIFRSQIGNENARRGAYYAYVSTAQFEDDNAVGEKDKSNVSRFCLHTYTASAQSSR